MLHLHLAAGRCLNDLVQLPRCPGPHDHRVRDAQLAEVQLRRDSLYSVRALVVLDTNAQPVVVGLVQEEGSACPVLSAAVFMKLVGVGEVDTRGDGLPQSSSNFCRRIMTTRVLSRSMMRMPSDVEELDVGVDKAAP
jgi:hypothetical protein